MNKAMFTNRASNDDQWVSVADLMAGLMMVFLFIAVIYAKDANQRASNVTEIVTEWQDAEMEIYRALEREFRDDLPIWNAEIERASLTIRFLSPEILFKTGKADLSDHFKQALDDFMPRYIDLLISKFDTKIDEVRIEGHTSSEWLQSIDTANAFINNMKLSQARTRTVLEYAINLPEMQYFTPWVIKKVSANGLSSARLITENGVENKKRSRRVEFTIKTKTKEAMFQILEKVSPAIEKSF
ncbi:OmpA/MotB family protein [Candidatus Puniceispirillum sp.]|uniref:OmpA/MotB family protein n=1 Tax=Candidatus Puniceispirillum sp. TaxID=2026719 RepID=UPI002FCE46DC